MSDSTPARAQQKTKTGVVTFLGIIKLLEAAFLLLVVLEAHHLLHRDVAATVREWIKEVHLDPEGKYLRTLLAKLLSVDAKKLHALGIVASIYFALHLTEGIGLLLHKRWAEYFTVISTSLLVPIEVYEIFHHITFTKVLVLLVNLAIVAYLIYRLWKYRETPGEATASERPRRAESPATTTD